MVDTCRQLGIGIGTIFSRSTWFFVWSVQFGGDSQRLEVYCPVFETRKFGAKRCRCKRIEAMASASFQLTLSQLSLAWVMNQGADVVPIPGTTSFERKRECYGCPMLNWQKKKWKKLLTRQVTS